ncbi:hypothetical protein [Hyunsoonleella pacifica]|uniref:Uncharacterized protein n=1 Tax=Hyunsoonleella pacifica TaxID=1080224 RepID=A0A4Q9FP02_9FLAO|nr:hypothetical protein [Hyunsoonleella pacifica]TBN16435.1 hypothetical protein EYD46_07265 [Hyunsoonleella pacifica]
MKKILSISIFMFFILNTYSQEDYVKLPYAKSNSPTIIIEKDIIANESTIEVSKALITGMSVMKLKPNRKEHKFFNLSEGGIVFVTLKETPAFKTQAELNEFFGIHKDNQVYLNGYLIEDKDYKIATNSIVEVELIKPDSRNKLEGKTINIWVTKKSNI